MNEDVRLRSGPVVRIRNVGRPDRTVETPRPQRSWSERVRPSRGKGSPHSGVVAGGDFAFEQTPFLSHLQKKPEVRFHSVPNFCPVGRIDTKRAVVLVAQRGLFLVRVQWAVSNAE